MEQLSVMEKNVGFWLLIKLAIKLVWHRIQQYRLATGETEVVTTSYGRVRGVKRRIVNHKTDSYYAFEGIPYARPPLGQLRFRAPQPPEGWPDIRDCTRGSAKPLQSVPVLKIIDGSEDCLHLNIYTKKLRTEKPLPVLIWIFGGGFQIGEASRDFYGPDYFMQQEVVLVTLNYRVGALGFLSLNDPDVGVPGNAGLKDQLMALRWIKQNIRNFNGDPDNITLFGESAGASCAHYIMTTEQAKGLFHKAILQSGTALSHWAKGQPSADRAYRLASAIGYKGSNNDKEVYRYLSKVNAKRIVSLENSLYTKAERSRDLVFAFAPVLEPYDSEDCVIRKPLKDMLPHAWGNGIPVIIGGNSFEGLFYYEEASSKAYLRDELGRRVSLLPTELIDSRNDSELEEMSTKVMQTFFNQTEPSNKDILFAYLDMMSYRSFWHGIHRFILARSKYATRTPTYCYRFDYDSPDFNHFRFLMCGPEVRGVSHGDEISYLFHNIISRNLPTTATEYRTIQRMVGMWTAFARTSDPNCPQISPVRWEPVQLQYTDRDNGKHLPIYKSLNISDDVEFIELPELEKLHLFDSFYTNESLL